MISSSLQAATLVTTDDGGEYRGEVVSAGVNSLTVKLSETGYQIIPLNIINLIKVDILGGSPIEGKLLDWNEGELTVRVGDRDISVREGTITSVREVTVPAGGPRVDEPIEPAADVFSIETVPAEETPANTSSAAPAAEPDVELELRPETADPESAPVSNATM